MSANHDGTSGGVSDFQWTEEHQATLERLAATDIVETEWPLLRDIIKFKINQNIASFLEDAAKLNDSASYIPPFSPRPSTAGGLKIAPFTLRDRNEMNPNEAPKSSLSEPEAAEVKDGLYSQLDSFEGSSSPPFTIQRLADLCLHPRDNYTALGKYLRAVEKTLYVTSTWDSFPPLPPQPTDPALIASTSVIFPPASVPSTPLFSPIPFLHDDARRSKSRSPPPSPLALNALDPNGVPLDMSLEPKALGLVDEMDDPRPGHLSERPIALSSVTSVGEGSGVISLEERFVRASEIEIEGQGGDGPETKRQRQDEGGHDEMVLDERDGDKENES
ncbi:hypothetical protein BV25DRAFT_1882024 [Artomyces pyxidatus]|uniref:Uncharacterized protein n=1 Tax=Artomyces pyxidatus TaxID=48021 RepID=A0ACB8T7Y6_9AGAM|nr:hypothetical protein BV25DRAFT_1882024 [Artomyces pyxidatus]